MLDFCHIRTRTKVGKNEAGITIYPEFLVGDSEDLMIRGGKFYAVWDERIGLWSKDPMTVCDIIDSAMEERSREYDEETNVDILYMRNFSSKKWSEFLAYCSSKSDNAVDLDPTVTFADQVVKREDYASKRLPYSLDKFSEPKSYDTLMSTLYMSGERDKLEWAIGSIFAGESDHLQKFIVLYGDAGSGKSTVLHIVEQLFQGYCAVFDAKALGSGSSAFALEAFRSNPLVAIQHDADLSRLEDNTKLNSIVSHEPMLINEKRKSQYEMRIRSLLFIGTNKPVRITDSKSGLIRRLIDVSPSGHTLAFSDYTYLMGQIKFELGAIACHCLNVYLSKGRDFYDDYRPLSMLGYTNDFYNFVEDNVEYMVGQDRTLNEIYRLYSRWCEETGVKYPMSRRLVKTELGTYFQHFAPRKLIGNESRRNVFWGFKVSKVFGKDPIELGEEKEQPRLELTCEESIFDEEYADCWAQLASESGTPRYRWENVKTHLRDIDTHELHYVRVPENHIVIDFDLVGPDGEKSLERNLEAAARFPTTYAELSKSGKGVHLHYIYDGDPDRLAHEYAPNIEVKTFPGNASLRRKLTYCNGHAIAHIVSGLPFKTGRKKKMLDFQGVYNEKALRTLIRKNLHKDIHPGTKPSVEFIKKILDDCYNSDIVYDVSDLKPRIIAFAANSTHHADYCLNLVNEMKFASERELDGIDFEDDEIIFYDVEVFPNLFVVVCKAQGEGKQPIKLINPTPDEVARLCKSKLVGFNNRRYDNHILYARMMGYTNYELYKVSQALVTGQNNATFREAYRISYADIYDFSSKKQSLKKFEIELGIHHQELGLAWDEEVPEELWGKVADYCVNDVIATEATFNARHADFVAREILAEISGLTVNDTNRMHATRIIFGKDKYPQSQFVYTDLSKDFPGYTFDAGKSHYRGEEVGEGGYVYAEPGMYENVVTLDVESMHPSSIIALNLFGDIYTARFKELLDTRLAIKHKRFGEARQKFDGMLAPYLKDEATADQLAYALKIVINSVYGLTSARFDCEFKDPRNVDNIVAKRGALFMIDLKHKVQELGCQVVHIKTDSIKIPNPTPDILRFVKEYGEQWGYNFEVESEYERFCLVNNAVYIAKTKDGKWSATGAQFKEPYVFKSLFSHEPLEFEDYCETKNVAGDAAIYLDKNEGLHEDEHDYVFVGRTGQFCPIISGAGGGILLRKKGDKYDAVTGTKGYRWLESEVVKLLELEGKIDQSYFENLAEEAVANIEKYGDFTWFVEGDSNAEASTEA